MKKAVLEDGIPCIGYLVWGIIDLVSAGGGEMDKRYGLVYVNKHNDGTGDLAATKKILLVGMHRRFGKSAMNKAYKQYFDLIFGSTLLTLGIYLFVTPNGINFGGVIGLAQIIEIFLRRFIAIRSDANLVGMINFLINVRCS